MKERSSGEQTHFEVEAEDGAREEERERRVPPDVVHEGLLGYLVSPLKPQYHVNTPIEDMREPQRTVRA